MQYVKFDGDVHFFVLEFFLQVLSKKDFFAFLCYLINISADYLQRLKVGGFFVPNKILGLIIVTLEKLELFY